MGEIIWMDFSGAPALLIPRRHAAQWNGFYLPFEEGDGAGAPQTADLVLPDGRELYISSDFDFGKPKTDYDRLCAWQLDHNNQGARLYPLGAGAAVALSDDGDGVIGWWPEQRMVLAISRYQPTPDQLAVLAWSTEMLWRVDEPELVLINACLHGSDLQPSDDQWTEVRLPVGSYRIETAELTRPYIQRLYRFTLQPGYQMR